MSDVAEKARGDHPFAYGSPQSSGVIRSVPEDFQVDEIAGFEPDGEGEHCLLHIQKRDSNTDWVAGQLARFAGVSRADVSYAGLKDRHAVTTQWFSVCLAGKSEPDWGGIASDEFQVMSSTRHGRKLRVGALKGNRFKIVIRDFSGDRDEIESRFGSIASEGVPNYFGEQRFGVDDSNMASARALFNGELKRLKRQKRGFYLSAVRSYLFNQVLAARVRAGNWNRPLAGERMMLEGTRSHFLATEIDPTLLERHQQMDVHASGPLWGRGEVLVSGEVAQLEQDVLASEGFWREGLEQFGLKMERRALRLPVSSFGWSIDAGSLEIAFTLPKGCYATTVLRECLNYRQFSSLNPLRESRT
ncbi:MAG: tRNA pseudouridine(13) synthase TruD [Sedimenticola sp.]|nr:tRNA pseudouridine(13) synthase TruD [Sedimenticola sp.]